MFMFNRVGGLQIDIPVFQRATKPKRLRATAAEYGTCKQASLLNIYKGCQMVAIELKGRPNLTWVLTSVHFHVRLEIPTLGESSPTYITLERSLSCVNYEVSS